MRGEGTGPYVGIWEWVNEGKVGNKNFTPLNPWKNQASKKKSKCQGF